MPTYRVQVRPEGDRTLQATRVVSDGAVICFENHVGRRWSSVLAVPVGHVQRVQRRVNEPNGSWRWILVRPEPALGHHVHR